MSATLQALVREHRFDRQIELVREHWRAVRHLWLDAPGAAQLGLDLPSDFLLGVGMPGIASIKPTDGGRFEFAEGAVTAVILPAYDTIPGNLDANPARHVDHLVDLVAVDIGHPDKFWRRRGEALVLGNAYLEIAGQECELVPVFRTPMSWLRATGAGICILDWDWTRDLLLDQKLIAEDLDLGAALEDALEPNIFIKEITA